MPPGAQTLKLGNAGLPLPVPQPQALPFLQGQCIAEGPQLLLCTALSRDSSSRMPRAKILASGVTLIGIFTAPPYPLTPPCSGQ